MSARRSGPRRAGAGIRLALLLAVASIAAGCATTGGAPAGEAPADGHRVLVTLAESQRASWDRITRQLELAYALQVHQVWRMRTLGVRCIVFDLQPVGGSPERVLRRLAADPRVESAQPIRRYRVLGGGGGEDPYAHLQHGAAEIHLDGAHRWASGRGVRVAVIDTGVDVTHPELNHRVVEARNFVDRGELSFTRDIHGTAVAGVLAAAAGNDQGIAGVAPEADLLVLKACWQANAGSAAAECDSYTLSKALDWALAEGCQVLNLSLAGPPDALLRRLLDAALDDGVTVVAAADDRAPPGFPASHPGVIAVHGGGAAAASAGSLGDSEPLSAPGVDILTTVPGGGYDFFSGSSMAAAQVSGVAALLLERRPGLPPAEVARLLRATAHPPAVAAGAGEPAPVLVVDACGAVGELLGRPEECHEPSGLARAERRPGG